MEKQIRDKNEFINFIKGITEKSTANIMFNSEKLKAFFQVREKKKQDVCSYHFYLTFYQSFCWGTWS